MSGALLAHARQLRRDMTPPERLLWQALRRWQLNGLKFRRQMPLGPFIVDFYCAAARVVVEVDGATHADPSADAARDAWLERQGIRVLHVWNNEVMGNLEGVLAVIAAACAPPPDPLPRGEGESCRASPSPRGRGLGGGVSA